MTQHSTRVLAVAALIAGLASGGWVFAHAAGPAAADAVDPTAVVESVGVLDGKTFAGRLGPMGKPADVEDRLVFADGTFVSTECHKTCDFPATPYFVRKVGDATEFISETRCPTKNAKIVWRGTVDGDTVKGVFTWTVNRWYWTVEKDFWFEGTLVDSGTPVASNP